MVPTIPGKEPSHRDPLAAKQTPHRLSAAPPSPSRGPGRSLTWFPPPPLLGAEELDPGEDTELLLVGAAGLGLAGAADTLAGVGLLPLPRLSLLADQGAGDGCRHSRHPGGSLGGAAGAACGGGPQHAALAALRNLEEARPSSPLPGPGEDAGGREACALGRRRDGREGGGREGRDGSPFPKGAGPAAAKSEAPATPMPGRQVPLPSAKAERDTQQVPGRFQKRAGALAQPRRRTAPAAPAAPPSWVESVLALAPLSVRRADNLLGPLGPEKGLRLGSGGGALASLAPESGS